MKGMEPVMKAVLTPVWALLVLVALPLQAGAQNARDLMQAAWESQIERLAGVENVTIVQEVMGMETTLRMEKRDMDGTPVLYPVSVSMGGMNTPIPQDMPQGDWARPFQEEWIERARLEGEETIDGHRTYVLAIDDFSGLEMPGVPGAGQGGPEITPVSVRMWLDPDGYLTRKVVMDMEARQEDGTTSDVHMEMFMEDYREVEGYVHPFLTRTVTEGLMESADVDQEELRAQLAEMRAQLESMPEAQRRMMEGILNSQIEQMEGMLGGEGGMEFTITVKELRVNSGGPF
jgi:hypothetical protein